MGSVYKRGNKLWLGYIDAAGKQRCVSSGLDVGQEREARKLLEKIEVQVAAGTAPTESGPMTVERFGERWIAERKKLGLRDVKTDEGRLRKHIYPRLGKMALVDVRPRHLIAFVKELRTAGVLASRTVHEGWDPFNVTEDCDLGARIFKRGFRTAIIDSVTLEEANSDVRNWIRQRSRWIKGYMQTYLVHMRHPVQFVRENGWHALIFQLVVGGKIGFMFINPFLWLATLTYFTLYIIMGPILEALFPPLVFYFAAISLIFGNFLYLYYYMIGTAKREHFQVVKYVFLVPFYWLLVSWAACIGLYELIVKPHYWQKTLHGLHAKK